MQNIKLTAFEEKVLKAVVAELIYVPNPVQGDETQLSTDEYIVQLKNHYTEYNEEGVFHMAYINEKLNQILGQKFDTATASGEVENDNDFAKVVPNHQKLVPLVFQGIADVFKRYGLELATMATQADYVFWAAQRVKNHKVEYIHSAKLREANELLSTYQWAIGQAKPYYCLADDVKRASEGDMTYIQITQDLHMLKYLHKISGSQTPFSVRMIPHFFDLAFREYSVYQLTLESCQNDYNSNIDLYYIDPALLLNATIDSHQVGFVNHEEEKTKKYLTPLAGCDITVKSGKKFRVEFHSIQRLNQRGFSWSTVETGMDKMRGLYTHCEVLGLRIKSSEMAELTSQRDKIDFYEKLNEFIHSDALPESFRNLTNSKLDMEKHKHLPQALTLFKYDYEHFEPGVVEGKKHVYFYLFKQMMSYSNDDFFNELFVHPNNLKEIGKHIEQMKRGLFDSLLNHQSHTDVAENLKDGVISLAYDDMSKMIYSDLLSAPLEKAYTNHKPFKIYQATAMSYFSYANHNPYMKGKVKTLYAAPINKTEVIPDEKSVLRQMGFTHVTKQYMTQHQFNALPVLHFPFWNKTNENGTGDESTDNTMPLTFSPKFSSSYFVTPVSSEFPRKVMKQEFKHLAEIQQSNPLFRGLLKPINDANGIPNTYLIRDGVEKYVNNPLVAVFYHSPVHCPTFKTIVFMAVCDANGDPLDIDKMVLCLSQEEKESIYQFNSTVHTNGHRPDKSFDCEHFELVDTYLNDRSLAVFDFSTPDDVKERIKQEGYYYYPVFMLDCCIVTDSNLM